MARYDQIKALLPTLINGKTHDQLLKKLAASDEKVGSHNYDGIKFPWLVPRSNLEALKTFEVRDDDIFVVTFPRSGTIFIIAERQSK